MFDWDAWQRSMCCGADRLEQRGGCCCAISTAHHSFTLALQSWHTSILVCRHARVCSDANGHGRGTTQRQRQARSRWDALDRRRRHEDAPAVHLPQWATEEHTHRMVSLDRMSAAWWGVDHTHACALANTLRPSALAQNDRSFKYSKCKCNAQPCTHTLPTGTYSA